MAVNSTYPLYPIVATICAAHLMLLLTSSFIRQSWNLGLCFLCFWLALQNLILAINSIIWASDAGIRLYVYCDIGMNILSLDRKVMGLAFAIVSRIQAFANAVVPASTLIITRRLHAIASMRAIKAPSPRKVSLAGNGLVDRGGLNAHRNESIWPSTGS